MIPAALSDQTHCRDAIEVERLTNGSMIRKNSAAIFSFHSRCCA
jgi:hypothetical protein